MQTKEKYLCKDCKHRFVKPSEWLFYAMGFNPIFWSCRKSYQPEHQEISLVTGTTTVKARYYGCTSSRIGKSREGNCGEDAFYWEPREKQDLFRYMKKVGDDASTSK